ncbi:MAG TPA: STAS/SEC14 domain-containing protein [Bacteroidia bacterium]|nr:STAS/SEC14 domain-containing protein [Bacteroidia bacterium]
MDNDLLRVTYTGTIYRKEMEEIMDKVYKLIREHDAKRVLIDALDSDVKLELFESLAFAKEYPPEFKQAKTAVVEKQEKREQYRVHETFADNRSFNMKFFNDIAEAEKWLGI